MPCRTLYLMETAGKLPFFDELRNTPNLYVLQLVEIMTQLARALGKDNTKSRAR